MLSVEQWLTLRRQYVETGNTLKEVRFLIEKMTQNFNSFKNDINEELEKLEAQHQKGWGYKDNIDKNKDIEDSF